MRINTIFSVTVMPKVYAFGNKGDLVSRSKKDLQQFKEKTLGSILIMGRKTYESMGSKDLPGRKSIVVSSKSEINSLDKALEEAKRIGSDNNTCFVIGGVSLISEGMKRNLFNDIYLTMFLGSQYVAYDVAFGREFLDYLESGYEPMHKDADLSNSEERTINGIEGEGSVNYLHFSKKVTLSSSS